MNSEIACRWVEALRSGNYNQFRSALRTSRGYCCLGVLCDLYQQEVGGEWDNTDSERLRIFFIDAKGVSRNSNLSHDVLQWAGFPDEDHFVKLNDQKFASFEEIADEIEEMYLQVP